MNDDPEKKKPSDDEEPPTLTETVRDPEPGEDLAKDIEDEGEPPGGGNFA